MCRFHMDFDKSKHILQPKDLEYVTFDRNPRSRLTDEEYGLIEIPNTLVEFEHLISILGKMMNMEYLPFEEKK
jgi:hypothetical protein